jgi:hypothetical protein
VAKIVPSRDSGITIREIQKSVSSESKKLGVLVGLQEDIKQNVLQEISKYENPEQARRMVSMRLKQIE